MRLAIFSDVHGNLPALKAVLKDMRSRGPDWVVCAGDLVGYGPFPNEVIELVREERILTVTGNYDDGVGHDRPDCGCAYRTERARENGQRSLEWTKLHTTPENKAFLGSLPFSMSLSMGDRGMLVVHGSPRKLNEYLYEDRPEATLRRILDGANAEVLIVGHTHIPYHRILDSKHLVNVGSVGKPKHGRPTAVYALVNLADRVTVSFTEVPYDFEAAARAVEAVGLPGEFAAALRSGQD